MAQILLAERAQEVKLLMLAIAFALSQSPSQPFPNHELPPQNWFCVPANTHHDPATDAHACACLGMQEKPDPDKLCVRPPPNENGDDTEGVPSEPNDNAKCKTYCHKDHCTCITQCESS